MKAVVASGSMIMSLSWMPCQPRIEEPSKPRPSSNTSSPIAPIGKLQCCHVPGQSMNRRSTITALFFFASSRACLAFIGSLSSL